METAGQVTVRAGTTLALDASVSDAPRPADVWRGRRNLYFIEEARTMSRWMVLAGGVVHFAVIAIFLSAHYPLWRVVAMGALYCLFGALQRFIVKRSMREDCVEASFVGLNVTAQLFVTVFAALTG